MVFGGIFRQFLSTPSARRATLASPSPPSAAGYFYPRPPRGGRLQPVYGRHRFCQISIHALREEGDLAALAGCTPSAYFYPRPPRGGRPSTKEVSSMAAKFLSTPSARRATNLLSALFRGFLHFYPRPPRGGRRPRFGRTPPPMCNFYPRPPRGGRHLTLRKQIDEDKISIHALREEGD